MKFEEITINQKIKILKRVKKQLLERKGISFLHLGLCARISVELYNLIPEKDVRIRDVYEDFTYENAKKFGAEISLSEIQPDFWWSIEPNFDYDNRIAFVDWMINNLIAKKHEQ
jgi:hypothetical protein